ncbi:MAG TPA: rod shape-determining protein RodA [Solirubrobacteraceae bacterium]|jgi:rod shape determining protein RodA|nr:rod shape-determining protein RodA [Solirubrobacteraceae bacterium]
MTTAPLPIPGTPIQPAGEPPPPERVGLLPFDPLLALATLALCVCSLVTLNSATRGDVAGQPHFYVDRQALYFGVGLVAMVGLSRVDYSRLRELKYGLYAALLGTIVLVLVLGRAARGSQRAITLPFFSFQASELGKVLLILALAAFVVDRSRRLADRDTTARVMLLALIPAVLVIIQPDLGSGMVYVVIALAALFVAGSSWRHFAALAALGAVSISLVAVAAPAVGVTLLKPYQVDRLTAFLNPTDNPRKQGYQQIQSKIAIGSGQKTGRGHQATQTKLNFLPEHHTDFIFAVVGEQYGFVGAALVLSLYALLIWRALRILTMAKNLYGALVAGGIVAMLMFQVFVNVGMTVGIMPITGVTLPLMSYGGSSVLTTLLAVGLLQSIYAQGRAATAYKNRVLRF